MQPGKCHFFLFILVSVLLHLSAFPAMGIMKIMPLGASITRGSSSGAEGGEGYYISYRKALWESLTDKGYEIDFVGSLNSGWEEFDDADHEGHGGWTDSEIVAGRSSEPTAGYLEKWLEEDKPNIVLIHIGTNELDPGPDGPGDIEKILEVIDDYNQNSWVILALIINRNCITDDDPCQESYDTTTFNDNVKIMAKDRINRGDKIIIVDMENDAGIDYHLSSYDPPGDMYNDVHPYETGYAKMAEKWFSGLQDILPVAHAGPYQTTWEGALVTLDGSGSYDPDDDIASYQWCQLSGQSVRLTDPDAVKPTFTAPDVDESGASLTFQLTVTDNGGLHHSDTCMVNVKWVNQPPSANAGPDQIVSEGATAILDGSNSSDPDDGIASYQWIQISGPSVTLSDTYAVQPAFTSPDADESGASLTFQLTVTDNGGLQDSDTCMVNVNWVNQPLSAKEGDQDWPPFSCFISTMTRD